MTVEPHVVEIWEDSAPVLMERIRGTSGAYMLQADFGTITYSTFDLRDLTTAIATAASLTVASVVFDTLQTSDPRWTKDSTGYNFLWNAPASLFPSGGKTYVVEIKFSPTSGDPYFAIWHVKTKPIATS